MTCSAVWICAWFIIYRISVTISIFCTINMTYCIDTIRQIGSCRGAILHSDRGSQYTSEAFRSLLEKKGIMQSLSGAGHCYDNARMESFFATLKKEKLYQIPTHRMLREEVKSVIFKYIFGYYNTQRINSFNPGGLPPVVYRRMMPNVAA